MSKQYLQFRHEDGGGTGHTKKKIKGGGGEAQFFKMQIHLNIFPLSVCLFVLLFPILKYWVQFHVSV